MCEWLSRGEWCDVQLVCGGRSFNAHRAVLASVSTFLRHILLSCPDETTTFIVLPDFDLEAMSSVLYYIYNGEVIMHKQKLALFLDIVRTMQIHVDYRYLCEIQQDEEEKYSEFEDHFKKASSLPDIFTLGFNNDTDQHIYNIKRCKETQRALLKYSQSDSDLHDTSVRCRNESEPGKSRLGNLKSPYESRQRNSLLRDLFIESYPRNGNVNGLTESVQAISNECYRSPASVLLANANCRHLSIDDTPLPLSLQTSDHSLHSSVFLDEDRLRTYDCNKECAELLTSNKIDPELLNFSARESSIYGKSEKFYDVEKNSNEQVKTLSSLLNENKINETFYTNTFVNNKLEHQLKHKKRKELDMNTKNTSKAILNHVMESPWHAKKPSNYRPFRKKDVHLLSSLKEYETEFVSDTNNNLQNATNPNEIISDEKQAIENSTVVENRESFKCTHCDQVFTSSESLGVHMRRHSATARYSCGECGKTFSQLRNFKYHMSIHRGTREFAATCTVCGKYFNDRGYLSSHMKIHRNRKEYKCSLCPKSFNQRVAYNMHVRIHTGVKPHVCEECGKAFSRKMLLKQHQRTHSGERPYACPHCDKRFADRSNMTLHLRLHTGVKPFSCPMCPKSFTKKHHLKSHLNFHTGSKPYSCPRCHLAFTQSSNMRTHYKKCTAPEPSTSHDSPSSLTVPF